MITGEQVRAARALLKWAQWRLASAAKVALKTVARLEEGGIVDEGARTSLRRALDRAGIEFLSGEEPSVRLRKKGQAITGRQIQEARRLLHLSVVTVAQRARLQTETVVQAEAASEEVAPLTLEQSERLHDVFVGSGIEFFRATGGDAGVRRRSSKP